MSDVLTVYTGLTLDRQGKCRCPLHAEDTASFLVYPETQSFYCFGCGAGGDAINFVERYLHLSPAEAVRDLNDRLHLGIMPNGSAQSNAEYVQALNANRQRQQEAAEWEKRLDQASLEVRNARKARDALPKPRTIEEGGAYAAAVGYLERREFLYQQLLYKKWEASALRKNT